MNYRELLAKYMQAVLIMTGTTCVYRLNGAAVGFSPEEQSELDRIRSEVSNSPAIEDFKRWLETKTAED